MKKRNVIVCLFFVIFVMIITSCNNESEEEYQDMISIDKTFYAQALQFDVRIVIDREEFNSFAVVRRKINPEDPDFDEFYTEFIFVNK